MKRTINTALLDIDGVLANFNKAALEALGIDWETERHKIDRWFWQIHFGVTLQELDNACTIDVWENMEWTPYGKELLSTVEESFGKENVILCTTPMTNPDFGTGRIRWIQKHLPDYAKRYIIMTAPKRLLARQGRVLIDDKIENCIEFSDAGGFSVLVPAPCNALADYDVMPFVKEQIREAIYV